MSLRLATRCCLSPFKFDFFHIQFFAKRPLTFSGRKMLDKASQSISHVNSQGNNHISVTHEITVRPDQPPCSQQRINCNLRKSGELEKPAGLFSSFIFQEFHLPTNAGAEV